MKIIDVHSHTVPQVFLKAMQAGTIQNNDNFPIPEWSVGKHLKMMDHRGIQACVVSVSAPGLNSAKEDVAIQLARTINSEHAEMIDKHPDRFGAFAMLPMPHIEASLREIEHTLDVMKLDGVGLYTNYNGVYLGDAKFAPVLDELHRRKAVVFVHPVSPPHSQELTLGYPAPMLEYPFDSTRMVVSLIDSGTLERCDHIRFIVCHGGGTLPLLGSRIGPLMQMTKDGNKLSVLVNMLRVKREIGSLFFDLAAATERGFLSALKETHDFSKLLMGFDFPFMPDDSIGRALDGLKHFEDFTDKERLAISGGNADKLFPRLANL